MTRRVRRYAALALIGAIGVLAGCVPLPADANWGHLSIVDEYIAVTFHDRMALIDPDDFRPVPLLDAEGQPRRDDQGNTRTWTLLSGARCIPDCFYAAPIRLDDDTLLLASYNKRLVEVDIDAARIDETRSDIGGHIVGNPILTDELVVVPFSELDVVALSREDYSEVWRLDTERGNWAQPLYLIEENLLIIPSMDHNLYAVDADSGDVRWTVDMEGAVGATPLLYDGYLYVGSFDGNVARITLDGQVTGTFTGAEEWIWGTPAIAPDEDGNPILYTADSRGFVYALAVEESGFRELWRRQVAQQAIRSAPIVHNEYVIVASRDQNVYWLNRVTGDTIEAQPAGGEVLADMLLIQPGAFSDIDQPTLIVLTMTLSPKFAVFNANTGGELGRYDF
jgi:outer membrane protein assembly factor BamB